MTCPVWAGLAWSWLPRSCWLYMCVTWCCRAAGAYIHGSVGSGKSLLMDLLHSSAEQSLGLQHVRRMHFNAAMMEVRAARGAGGSCTVTRHEQPCMCTAVPLPAAGSTGVWLRVCHTLPGREHCRL
jgi:hypothetical protein